jgi:DNA-binding beta-propeller fold protein YncE
MSLNRFVCSLTLILSFQAIAAEKITTVKVKSDPYSSVVTKDSSRAYVISNDCVTDITSSEVDVIDLKAKSVTGRIFLERCASKVFLNGDETKLYVNNNKLISVIDTKSLKIINEIKFPENVTFAVNDIQSQDKKKIYYEIWAAFHDQDKPSKYLLAFDTKTEQLGAPIPLEWTISRMAISPDGRTIFQASRPYYMTPTILYATDTQTKESIKIGESPILVNGFVISKDGKTLFLSGNPDTENEMDWYIYTFDIESKKFRQIYYAEHEIKITAINDDNSKLYLLHKRERHPEISIIHSKSGIIMNSYPLSKDIGIGELSDVEISSDPLNHSIYFTTTFSSYFGIIAI